MDERSMALWLVASGQVALEALFPLFMLLMRCWSVVAMLNEALRRGHEETSMAPWWVLKKAKKF